VIQEISNFVDTIQQEYHTEGLKPSPGLHILIDLDETGELKANGYKSLLIDKNGKCFELTLEGELKEVEYEFDFEIREFYSQTISMNKAIDSRKKIHSSVPYVLWFKPENLEKLEESFDEYFSNCKTYAKSDDEVFIVNIENFSKERIKELIINDPKFKKVDKKNYVRVYFVIDIEKLKASNEEYLSLRLFNKDDYNVEIDGEMYGLSDFLNGANIKKLFMLHQSTKYKVNNRIPKSASLKLYQFERLLKKRKLPNIVPIFIDKEELNKEFVRIFSRDKTLSFREIIRQLFKQHEEDISNYYLINWANRQGIVINDIDYVPKFKFFLNDFTIMNIIQLPNTQERDAIKNIFDFEMTIVQKIFNNALIVKTKTNTVLFKYFDDIDAKYTTPINYQNILKYRKCFYDFIYKSKEDAINGKVFYNLLLSTIIDDIKHDEYKDNRHTKDFSIKEKLNILFSLNKNFDKLNKNFGGIDMPTKIPEFQENMRRLLNDNEYHIQTDQEFAFAAGQLIYSILKKSKSSNKSHALLEPFINKNDPTLFHDAILRGINQYKHAFEWYGEAGKGRFEKLTSEILGYECEASIKELLPIILAGYFSQSLIFEKSNKKEGE